MKRILIAGGSGFVGEYLRRLLVSHYFEVYILSTQKSLATQQHVLYWFPYSKEIDLRGIDQFDAIINLAGAGIADKLWTKKRREELLNSRVKTIYFLQELLDRGILKTDYLVQASAIGIYGDRGYEKLDETATSGEGYLSNLTEQWESASQKYTLPHSIVRIGIVFDPYQGAFPKLIMGLKFRFMVIFGNGRQYISWIDIQDLTELIYFLINRKEVGVFNAVSPQPVQYIYLLKKFNSKFGCISIPFSVPAFILKWLIGDFSELFLFSQKVCSRKIEKMGFHFQVKNITSFLKKNRKKWQ